MSTRVTKRLPLIMLIALWLSAFGLAAPLGRDARSTLRAMVDPGTPAHIFGPCDFLAFWTAGRMVATGDGAGVYQTDAIIAQETTNLSTDRPQLPFFYPPTGLLLPRLVAMLPFITGFWVWAFGLAAASVLLLRSARLPWPVIIAALLSPAALLNATLGQFGLFSGALFVAGLYFAARNPKIAGVLFGLLAFKPQLALLAPFVLLHRGRRLGLFSGTLTGVAIAATALVCFGPGIWRDFVSMGLPVSQYVLRQPFPGHPPPIASSFEFYGTSVLWMFRSLGFSYRSSALMQATVTAIAGLICWRLWIPRPPDLRLNTRIALTACLAMLATPYGYLYDLCDVSIAIATLAYEERRLLLSDVILWTWPVLGLIIAMHFYVELTPIIIGATALRVWRSL